MDPLTILSLAQTGMGLLKGLEPDDVKLNENYSAKPGNSMLLGNGRRITRRIGARVEKGEVVKTPDGAAYSVGGGTHESGNDTPIMAEPGTEVYSADVKIGDKSMADMEKDRMYREAKRLKSLKKITALVKENDVMKQNTGKRMLMDLVEEALGDHQERQDHLDIQDALTDSQEKMETGGRMKGCRMRGCGGRIKEMGSGGRLDPIKIKPENEGKFTDYAKSKGMSVQEAAHWVKAHSDNPDLIKEATFAINAKKWNRRGMGGRMQKYELGTGEDGIGYDDLMKSLFTKFNSSNLDDRNSFLTDLRDQMGEDSYNKLVEPSGGSAVEFKNDPIFGWAPYVGDTPLIQRRNYSVVSPLPTLGGPGKPKVDLPTIAAGVKGSPVSSSGDGSESDMYKTGVAVQSYAGIPIALADILGTKSVPNFNIGYGDRGLAENTRSMGAAAVNKAEGLGDVESGLNRSLGTVRNTSRGIGEFTANSQAVASAAQGQRAKVQNAFMDTVDKILANRTNLLNAQDEKVQEGAKYAFDANEQQRDNAFTQLSTVAQNAGLGMQKMSEHDKGEDKFNIFKKLLNLK